VIALPHEEIPRTTGVQNAALKWSQSRAGAEGQALQQLQLWPACYLVIWSDQDGLHVRQGVPMINGTNSRQTSGALASRKNVDTQSVSATFALFLTYGRRKKGNRIEQEG
jgi:hypothetical protein